MCRECLWTCRDVPRHLQTKCVTNLCGTYGQNPVKQTVQGQTAQEDFSNLLPYDDGNENLNDLFKRYVLQRESFTKGLDYGRDTLGIPVRKRLLLGTLETCISLKCGGLEGVVKKLCSVSRCHNSEKWW